MKKLLSLVAAVVCVLSVKPLSLHADPLVWQFPGGQIGLPFQSTELLMGGDLVLKQGISGVSLPVLTLFKGKEFQVDGQVGAVGSWPTQSANIQPYVAIGHDIARDIPVLQDFKSVHLNGFGRWASDTGKPGAGLSVSYSFNG